MTVLVIDDSADSRNLIQAQLRSASIARVMTAGSAKEVFALLRLDDPSVPAEPVDLILLDVVMPDIDGIEACRQIKNDDRYRDVPVIMVTANSEMDCLKQAFNAGASDYITKPLKKVELLARCRSALRLKEETDRRKDRENDLLLALKQLEEANDALRRLSSQDGLTGIANRRNFDNTLEREWQRALRENTPLSLVLFDIDFFKRYNDNYGHQLGDECLKTIARTAATVVKRAADALARYGGEEFAVILPNTDNKGAFVVADSIRQAVEAKAVPHIGSSISPYVTVSVGVATLLPDQRCRQTDLIEMADKSLYQAKQIGRNRVVVAN